MCTKSLSCILCGQPNFPNIDALRVSLLKVTARPLKCPICGDELLGLDKLTIHLFGHSLLEDQQTGPPTSVPAAKNEPKRNSSFSAKSKVRKKATAETEVKRAHGTDGRIGKPSPTVENSQPASNATRCPECNVVFRNSALLKMHREVFHDNAGNGSVPEGATATSDGGSDTRYYCHICPKEFKMRASLKIHLRVVHDQAPKKVCLEDVSHRGYEASAATTTTPGSEVTMTNLSTLFSMLDQQPNVPAFPPQSSPAGGSEPAQVATDAHLIQVIDPRQLAQVVYHPPTGSFSLPSSPQQGHDNAKQWECEVCHKSFTTKYFLKKHNRLHTGEMPYTCGICNKSFTFQQSYHKHLLYHSDDKPHACAVCNRAFKELSTLHNHERIHSGEKPFACETCGKCFRQRVSYLVHRRIHTGLMPYKCSGCDKSFRYKVSQRTHKCPANPPGMVVRKTGDLLQKLLQSSAILPESATSTPQQADPMYDGGPNGGLCHADTEPLAEADKHTADYVNRTLEELVKGTYDKLGDISGPPSSLLYESQAPSHQLYVDTEIANQLGQLPDRPQPQPSSVGDSSFPRIESLCLLSPSAFDSGQLEDLEGLKLDNGW